MATTAWIKTSERNPEKGGDYLTFTEGGVTMVLPYYDLYGAWNDCDGSGESRINVKYWMPIPAVPEEAQ